MVASNVFFILDYIIDLWHQRTKQSNVSGGFDSHSGCPCSFDIRNSVLPWSSRLVDEFENNLIVFQRIYSKTLRIIWEYEGHSVGRS